MSAAAIPCIGAALWDVIGRADGPMPPGGDVPGRIAAAPGGVALNVAAALARAGLRPVLLSAVGCDPEGDALVAACDAAGIGTDHLLRDPALPTDRYLAIEAGGALVAAVADARSLEAAGARILAPLADGRLGTAAAPFAGTAVIDGNLSAALLAEIAGSPLLAAADLRVVAAAPGKAVRLRPLLGHPRAVLHVNRTEAGLVCGADFADAPAAAAGLVAAGAARAIVTDGAGAAADAVRDGPVVTGRPAPVTVLRVTGAGDAFLAAHLAAEAAGADRPAALAAALDAAARHIATPTEPAA